MEEIKELECRLAKLADDTPFLNDFLSFKSKRLRPKIIFLILKMLNLKITPSHKDLALMVEVLHNATLLHDDIIDEADTRRENISINKKFGNKVALLGGDYLLSLSIELLFKINNKLVTDIFISNIQKMIKGEIDQYFERGKIPTIEEYIEKTKNKTALLFYSGVKSALILSDYEGEDKEKAEEFALQFGICFQILNDIASLEDDKNKIYTIGNILSDTKNKSDCDMIGAIKYLDKMIDNTNKILDFADNKYKTELVNILKNLKGDMLCL